MRNIWVVGLFIPIWVEVFLGHHNLYPNRSRKIQANDLIGLLKVPELADSSRVRQFIS
jgi:hypothetical protein